MLQEMELKKALEAYLTGHEVLVISGITDVDETIILDKMQDYFAECRFLVDISEKSFTV